MEKESLIKRYLVFIAGLYFLAMGISLIVHSSLGTTPISSMNYVLSINTSLSIPRYMDIYCKSAHDYHPTMAGKRQIWDT